MSKMYPTIIYSAILTENKNKTKMKILFVNGEFTTVQAQIVLLINMQNVAYHKVIIKCS